MSVQTSQATGQRRGGIGVFLCAGMLLACLPSALLAQDGTPSPPPYGPVDEKAAKLHRDDLPIAIPPQLDQAASLAATTHPLVDGAQAEADALEAETRGARWARFPSLSVDALAATSGSNVADRDGLALNAALEQPIWYGGRIGGEIDRAEANQRAGESRVDVARQAIVFRVIQAYYDYAMAQERLSVLRFSLRQHNDLLASIGRRVEQEVSPRADLTLGQSRTAQVELDLATALEMRDNARARLLELTGGAEVDPVLPLPHIADLLPPERLALEEAMACDPNLGVLTHLVSVAEAQSDIARAQLLPQLLFQLSQNEITGARAAVVLRMRLGNGAAQFAAIDSSDARIKRALADYGDAQRQTREQLRRDYIIIRSAQARIDAGEIAAQAADQIVESYKRQFIAGRRSWLDVMNAVREAASARMAASDARVMAAMSSARILARTCRWQTQLAEAQP